MRAADMPAASDLELGARAVEAVTGLSLCIHDLSGRLGVEFPVARSWHGGPVCALVKASVHEPRCVEFEIFQLRPELGRWRNGRIHRCHAGLVEWMVPVFDAADQPAAVLFAGQRRAAGFEPAVLQKRSGAVPLDVPEVDASTSQHVLEILRHFADRIAVWLGRFAVAAPPGRARAAVIHHFLDQRHRHPVALTELARHLDVPVSSVSHVVRSETGLSWRELLFERRLRTACQLLSDSALSVGEVALQSGFGDQSHFQRSFKQRLGLTPKRWRRERALPQRS